MLELAASVQVKLYHRTCSLVHAVPQGRVTRALHERSFAVFWVAAVMGIDSGRAWSSNTALGCSTWHGRCLIWPEALDSSLIPYPVQDGQVFTNRPGHLILTMYVLQQTPVSGHAHLAQPAALPRCRAMRVFGARHAGARCKASADYQTEHVERRGVLLGLSAAMLATLPQLPARAADEGTLLL